jgi:hypothetical protein
MLTEQEFNNHVAWFRYLHAAQVFKEQFEATLDLPEIEGFVYGRNPTSFLWMTYWYSSLYVVIEAWQELGLRSPLIDFLLERQQGLIAALKRFRNAVFHYQKQLHHPKLAEFLQTGEKSVLLIRLLHDSFVRYYWEWLEALPGTEVQQKALRENVAAFVGWIPRTITDDVQEMNAKLQYFTAELERDKLSEEARRLALDIKKSLEEFPGIAQTASADLYGLREQMIMRLFETDITEPMEEYLKRRSPTLGTGYLV